MFTDKFLKDTLELIPPSNIKSYGEVPVQQAVNFMRSQVNQKAKMLKRHDDFLLEYLEMHDINIEVNHKLGDFTIVSVSPRIHNVERDVVYNVQIKNNTDDVQTFAIGHRHNGSIVKFNDMADDLYESLTEFRNRDELLEVAEEIVLKVQSFIKEYC